MPDTTPDSGSVVARLRRLIDEGRYPAGTRLAEIPVAEALGVSRTPVRLAFRTLAQEGLLQPHGKRGFVVREFAAPSKAWRRGSWQSVGCRPRSRRRCCSAWPMARACSPRAISRRRT